MTESTSSVKNAVNPPLLTEALAAGLQELEGLRRESNELVLREGGRIYLAKDAFTRGEHYRAMDPRVPAFEAARAKWDPNRRWKSALSVRIFGDEA